MAWHQSIQSKLIQAIINKLYRYPKAQLKRVNEFGGYLEYKKMMRNQALMAEASLHLPPVVSYPYGLPVYFLTGEKFLYQTLFCIQSLNKYSGEKFRFFLVDDGSLSVQLIERINKQLPGAIVISKASIDIDVEKHLPEHKYPILRRKRNEYPHIKKLIDVHIADTPGWKLLLDSDMLFFNDPLAISNWLKNPTRPLHMIDCQESYGYSIKLMEQLAGNKIPDLLNVGVIGMNSQFINWDKLENWVKILEEQEGRSYYLEQALSAMLLAGYECTILEKDQYIVNPSPDVISSSMGVLHHYVDVSKKGYFNRAWQKVV